MSFKLLYQDQDLVAIEKPAGFHVHPPENTLHKIPAHLNCLAILKNQLNAYLYPVHRLDRATSGVLVFGLTTESAGVLAQQFRDREAKKTYFCVVRGWVQEEGVIDSPLASGADLKGPPVEATTYFKRIAQVELPHPVGRYSSARYSLLSVEPKTGRMHQIRRHFEHLRHPLIGDTIYGDGRQNRFFRETLGIEGLMLKAYALELRHPKTNSPLRVQSRWNHTWHQVFEVFGVCPICKP